ncbi:hypothetical protein BH11PLA2_BH11PLA2_40620 [soil metagenome]
MNTGGIARRGGNRKSICWRSVTFQGVTLSHTLAFRVMTPSDKRQGDTKALNFPLLPENCRAVSGISQRNRGKTG